MVRHVLELSTRHELEALRVVGKHVHGRGEGDRSRADGDSAMEPPRDSGSRVVRVRGVRVLPHRKSLRGDDVSRGAGEVC